METTTFHGHAVARLPRVVVSKPGPTIDGRTVVELRGELDAAALNSLVDTFDEAITQDGGDVVVDLADVEFIGAGWIGTLVRSRARLEMQDRELTLRSPPRVVHRLLDLCGLGYLIEPVTPGRGRVPTFDLTPN